ncbi:hypothetical protein HXX25_00570 [Hyphobacterium sp. CCMP332]|uniref:hypothetical protein n=1 Tax=Hyphobacterium sp. CCMP332 TaxID=2749086 RepID=UPI0016507B58|nr:hypothetical protein [Hyphobacterium sp. CCMP332]QNL17958.1 hypothetical protein HXX25_00570 [Hyphobacterium sp. CCMP332]
MKHVPTIMLTALLLAACSPSEVDAPDGASVPGVTAEQMALDPESLNALLLAEADNLVPSDWSTGEPAPDTALVYWYVPELREGITADSDCTPQDEPASYDCTLTLTAPNPEADEEERRDVTAMYRLQVRVNDDNSLTLLSPNVRWAVQG